MGNQTMLDRYLESVASPMHRAKAKASLQMLVRVNGATTLVERRALIEQRIASGSKVISHRGAMVLMNADDSWLDTRNITKHGLNYAAWLSVN